MSTTVNFEQVSFIHDGLPDGEKANLTLQGFKPSPLEIKFGGKEIDRAGFELAGELLCMLGCV